MCANLHTSAVRQYKLAWQSELHSASDPLTHFRASTCGEASRIGSGAGPLSALSAVPSSAFFLRRLGFAAAFCSCSAFTSAACPAHEPACSRLVTASAAYALLPGAPWKSGSALTCAALAAAARRRFRRTASEDGAEAAVVAARTACRPRLGAPPVTALGMCALTAERSIKRAGKCQKVLGAFPGKALHVRVPGGAGGGVRSRSREVWTHSAVSSQALSAGRRAGAVSPPAGKLQINSCRALRACLPWPR